jgi:8-oxo-dGTP pyrophosphatase MutT (NUDIX family)
MVRRHVNSDFAPDVYVFPGGKVDPGDRDPALAGYLSTAPPGPERVDFPDPSDNFRMAALRELFEEVGVLLAEDSDGRILKLNGDRAVTFEDSRQKLHRGELSLASIAEQRKIRYAPHLLRAFSHWVTPLSFPRRYNTKFFVTTMPEGQEPLHDAIETTHGAWISPKVALKRYQEGDFPLVFATLKQLERMSRFESLGALADATRPNDLEPIMPRPIERDGETDFLLPGDEGYASP